MKSTLFLSAATLLFSAAQAQVTDTTGRSTQTDTTGRNTQTGTMGNTTQTMGTTSTSGNTQQMGTTATDNARKTNQYGSYSTRDSIAAKYKLLPMPGGLTIEKTFPVLGVYQLNPSADASGTTAATTGNTTVAGTNDSTLNTTDASAAYGTPQVTITLDSASKGIVWVEGLEQGRFKAYLKKSPATYRIVAQKTAEGTAIPEGTLHLDTATNTLHIAMGAAYQDTDPTAVFYSGATVATDAADVTATGTTKAKSKTAKTKAKPKVKIITATKVVATEQQATGVQATQQSGQQLQEQQ